MVKGWKSLGMGLPFVWGLRAVPAGGFWAGVKYEMPLAGATGTFGQVMVVICRVKSQDRISKLKPKRIDLYNCAL